MAERCILVHRPDAIKLRNYGRIVQDLVAYATSIPDEPRRRAATIYIARCMRLKNQLWNKDFESGIERLKEDIATLSDGRLSTSFPEFDEALMRAGDVTEAARQQRTKSKQKKQK